MRLRVERLCAAVLGLADYGPAKPEAEKGLDSIQAEADAEAKKHGEKVPDHGQASPDQA